MEYTKVIVLKNLKCQLKLYFLSLCGIKIDTTQSISNIKSMFILFVFIVPTICHISDILAGDMLYAFYVYLLLVHEQTSTIHHLTF